MSDSAGVYFLIEIVSSKFLSFLFYSLYVMDNNTKEISIQSTESILQEAKFLKLVWHVTLKKRQFFKHPKRLIYYKIDWWCPCFTKCSLYQYKKQTNQIQWIQPAIQMPVLILWLQIIVL